MDIVITDDSLMFRSALSCSLSQIDGFNVIQKFSDGNRLVDYIKGGGKVDVIILDLEMPFLDGLSALVEIRKINKDVKIIMFSSATLKGAEKTIKALAEGADDFVPKIENDGGGIAGSLEQITTELVPKIRALYPEGRSRSERIAPVLARPKYEKKSTTQSLGPLKKFDLLCIGSSTGGPDALIKVFEKIVGTPNCPMLLVQHMPPVFTSKLAHTLSSKVSFTVKEAEHDELLESGVCYIAPGDYHLKIRSKAGKYFAVLEQSEKVCHVRPSVDVTLMSVNETFVGSVGTFILTGMGSDGANGAEMLCSKKGNQIYIQDEASSVVWGMPGAVYKKNIGAHVLDISEIGVLLNKLCEA